MKFSIASMLLVLMPQIRSETQSTFIPKTTLFGGPSPNGWNTTFDVEEVSNLAIDMAWMYEHVEINKRYDTYAIGSNSNQNITLKSLGKRMGRFVVEDPVINYHMNCFNAIGRLSNEGEGMFDERGIEDFADTLVTDLFYVEDESEPIRGIEKEGVLIFNIWMEIYHNLYSAVRSCQSRSDDSETRKNSMLYHLDNAMALWIGRFQSHGDNNKGTMFYNLVERIAIHFNQDHGEAFTNSQFMQLMKNMRQTVLDGKCDHGGIDKGNIGYHELYTLFQKAVSTMNVPLVQSLMHSIAIGSNKKLIELYLIAIMPQLRACNMDYFDYLLKYVEMLSTGEYGSFELVDLVSKVQYMYSCLGVSCNTIGIHSTGLYCDDDDMSSQTSFAGYNPEYDVGHLAKLDRDVNQIKILLEEKNLHSAKELYRKGANVLDENSDLLSLQMIALNIDVDYTSNENMRIYKMFESFYGNRPQYSDDILLHAIEDKSLSQYTVPTLMKALVLPHYAIRSFFASVDTCMENPYQAEEFWDRGVAVLVGSIESQNLGNVDGGSRNGMTWLSMSKEYCQHFECDFGGSAPAHVAIFEQLELGRQAIEKADCQGVRKRVSYLESIIMTPVLQGLLYHSALRSKVEGDDNFAHTFALAKSVMPLLIAREENYKDIIGDSIYMAGDFDATPLWLVVTNSFQDFGVSCEQMGYDTLGILQQDVSFCDLIEAATEFPTAAPIPGQSRMPTRNPTSAPTTEDAGNEINPSILNGYQFNNPADSLKKAKLALDLRDLLYLRGHVDVEHEKALKIYSHKTHSDASLKELSDGMKSVMWNNPFFIFYVNAFRFDPLFAQLGDDPDASAEVYAHRIIVDALIAGEDIGLAIEAMVTLTIWMHVVQNLHRSLSFCETSADNYSFAESAGIAVDTALAYYVGVSQSKGRADGYLLYNLAQKSGKIFGTFNAENGEANANTHILRLMKELKEKASQCDGSRNHVQDMRVIVGSIIKYLNVPLIQSFYYQLTVAEKTDKSSFYATLYGLATLPQVASCQPSDYYYLTHEITENGLHVANVKNLKDTLRKTYDCFGVNCFDIHGEGSPLCREYKRIPNTYAGFSPIEDVTLSARIDRDILRMNILMSEDSWDAATDYYTYGHLTHAPDTSSFQALARDSTWKQNPFYMKSQKYHNDQEMFADNLIQGALSGDIAPFNDNDDRKDFVLRSLQTLVLIPAGVGFLYRTTISDKECSLSNWERGASYLIGTLEGTAWGGDEAGNGVSFYDLAKEMCEDFGTCTRSGDADMNVRLISLLKGGDDLTAAKSCGTLSNMIESKIFPSIMIPIIQGAIRYAANEENNGDAFVFSHAVLPFVSNYNIDAANIIKDVLENPITPVTPIARVVDAFETVVKSMKINCFEIGSLHGNDYFSTCGEDTFDPLQSSDLSGGLYITKTYVDDRAKIGLDVKEMIERLELSDIAGAKIIYESGWNSEIPDSTGKAIGTRSLASFSNNTSILMGEEPIYNLYRYALEDVLEDGQSVAYGHNIVESYFDTNIWGYGHETLAAEAAVALNMWGFIVHKVYETLDLCINQGLTKDDNGVHSIDEAVAYWIGSNQETGSKTSGYLLYRLTEEGGGYFDIAQETGQTETNEKILRLFKEAALQLTFTDACVEGDVAIETLGATVEKLVAQMTIPLLQHLIYNLKKNDRKRVKMYAFAVVPLIAPCAQDTYDFLKYKLLLSNYEVHEVDTLIDAIQSTYSCLGLKCRDIGFLKEYITPVCIDRGELRPLAGYVPSTDVREFSDLDVDIRYIDIMMQRRAYDAAIKIYSFGKHSTIATNGDKSVLALRSLAITTGRTVVPSFEVFTEYFSKFGMEYADDMIRLQMSAPVSEVSDEQRRALVVTALKYEVLVFAALQKLYSAAEGCSAENNIRFEAAMQEWDVGAAMIVGSNQSPYSNGDLIYNLAVSMCPTFNTCDPETDNAKINQKIEEALFAGSYQLRFKQCESVRNYAKAIEDYMKVPLIQATLHFAMKNEDLDAGTQSADLAEGYVFSRSILPYLHQVDPSAASVISRNLNFQFTSKPVEDGSKKVFAAMKDAIEKSTSNIDCRDIGYLESGQNVCPRGVLHSSSPRVGLYLSSSIVLIATLLFVFV